MGHACSWLRGVMYFSLQGPIQLACGQGFCDIEVTVLRKNVTCVASADCAHVWLDLLSVRTSCVTKGIVEILGYGVSC